MNFLNTSILFGLVAALLPLIIHLFTRSKSKTIRFSTLEFLKELQQQKIRRIKLKQILLLLLRMLIIVFLVLAFARPTIRGGLSGVIGPNAKTSAVIILDNSFSMNSRRDGKLLFEDAREKAVQISKAMQPGDDVFLLTSTDTTGVTTPRSFHNFDALRREIEERHIDFRLTDISDPLLLAHNLLNKSNNINKELYILSDFQKCAFSADSLPPDKEKIRTLALPFRTKNISNLSVQSAKLSATILEKGKVVELEGLIKNAGNQPARNKLAQLFVNGERVAQVTLSVEPTKSATEKFKFVLKKAGFVSGYILLEDDDILQDNRHYFSFNIPDKIRVAMFGERPADTEYISLVLRPAEHEDARFIVDKIPLAKMRYTRFEKYDVIVLANIPAFDAQEVERLKDFVRAGGGIFLTLGQDIDIKSYNMNLMPELGLPKLTETMGSVSDAGPAFSLGKTDLTHPLFRGIFDQKDVSFSKPVFHFAIKTVDMPGTEKIMQYGTGDPFLLEKKSDKGKILFFTTGFNLQLTDITRRTIFAPLVSRAVTYLGTPTFATKDDLMIGDELRLQVPAQNLNDKLEMQRPDNKSDELKAKILSSGPWIYYSDTSVPGIYRLTGNEKTIALWAVNVDPRESDLTMADKSLLRQKYAMTFIDPNSDLPKIIRENRFGRELWKYFAIIAFILLLIEMMLYRQKSEVAVKK
ncbi:MAG: VWA domain-containing protein [Calditrichaeota bacterium]|nr:VWA domain-containing protein [Calditrichota bacterium]